MPAQTTPAPAPAQSPQKPAIVPKHARHRRSRRWLVLGVVVVLGVGAYAAYNVWSRQAAQAPAAAAVKTAKAFVGPLDVTLRISGQTSARNFANVTAPMLRGPESRSNMTLVFLAKGGVQVKKGDMLAQIDMQPLQDRLDDLRDTVLSSENEIGKRRAQQQVEWESMQQTLRVAKAQLEKARLDYQAAEVRTQVERELLKLAADEAEARHKQQMADVEQRRRSQTAELRILEITADRTKRRVDRFEHDLQRFKIMAPMNGLAVISTTFRGGGEMVQMQQGDMLAPGMPLMKIVDLASMQVEGSVSQTDSSDLRVGQQVRIGLDAFSDLRFQGRVYSIGALAVSGGRSQGYVRTVPVRMAIQGTDPRLIPDLSAHCDVVIETLQNQLQVPVAAVTQQNGQATVMVRNGDGWAPRQVALGKRNNTNVAIASGLQNGEEILLNR
jgi:multidrug efflux pump subunit AcrA (membrane-fusion protein)